MATKTKVLRVSMYLKRKEGLSAEEFNKYWSEVHGPLVRPLVEKYGILKYTQVSGHSWRGCCFVSRPAEIVLDSTIQAMRSSSRPLTPGRSSEL
jgi:hypothetical protein